MRYQFQIDNRPAGQIRKRWEDAAQDAVSNGYGVWVDDDEVRLAPDASIERIEE